MNSREESNMKTRYEVRQMKDNKMVEFFRTEQEAYGWLMSNFPEWEERVKYYVSKPIEEAETLEELFEGYFGDYQPGEEDLDLDEMIDEKQSKSLDKVFDKYKDVFDSLAKEFLVLLAIKNKGVWEDIYDDLMNNVDVYNHLRSDAILFDLYHSDIKAVTIFEDEYPAILKQSYKPPFVLFYTGDLKLAEKAIDSSGIMGQEFLAEVINNEGFPVTLIGKEQIEIKTPDSFLFVSTTFGGGMTEREQARLFLQLSKYVYFDNVPERKLVTLVMMLANKFNVKIFSKRTEWVKEVAGDNVEFVDSFNGTI